MRRTLMTALVATALSTGLAGCETLSEDTCAAGDWEGIGFRDGTNGQSRARLADISKACGKYNILPDRAAYLRGLEDGLRRYCVPDNGYRRGRDGSGLNNECSVRGFADYVDAHAEGHSAYRLEADYKSLIREWKATDKALANVTERLTAEEALLPEESERLHKKRRRLEREADDLRIDIRAAERLHGFPRWTPSG